MQRKTSVYRFKRIRDFFGKIAVTAILLAAFAVPAFTQDDEEVEFGGKVVDSGNRQVGRADFIQHSGLDVKIMFGYYIKMWLDGGKLRIIHPESGTRSTTINCYFREYKVDSSNPNDTKRWNSIGSGTASLQMPPEGGVERISVSMTLTKKVSGDDEVEVNEKPQKFVIVIN